MDRYKKEYIIVVITGIFGIIILFYPLIKPANNTPCIITNTICFNSSNPSSYQSYINNMINIVDRYRQNKKLIHCNKRFCVSTMEPVCKDWGFNSGQPCVFFTFSNNSQYNFYNDDYNDTDSLYLNRPGKWDYDLYQFWIYCFKYNTTTFNQTIKYFFPKFNIDDGGYLPPIVGVQVGFLDKHGIIVPGEYNVECNLLQAANETEKVVEKMFLHIKQGKPCT